MATPEEVWPGSEEFDLERLPGNPCLMETFMEYWSRLRRFVGRTKWPPGTKFLCRHCGNCCLWNFWILKVESAAIARLRKYGDSDPHGHWFLAGDKVEIRLPVKEGDIVRELGFGSPKLSNTLLEFFQITGRFHGYWVLNPKGRIVAYSPVKCPHLTRDNLCKIYETRPRVCRSYICRRYPVI